MYPFIEFFGIRIPCYGLCMLIALAVFAGVSIKKCSNKGIAWYNFLTVFACAVFGVVCGGALLYVFITYPPKYIISCVLAFDFDIFKSGIVFYGGFIGGMLGTVMGTYISRVSFYTVEQEVVFAVSVCHAIGRIGCLLSGCCYGMEYSGILAVKNYTVSPNGDMTFFPVQLLEAFMDILIAFCLYFASKKPHRKYDLVFDYMLLYGIMRFFGEFLRADDVRGIYAGLSTSQWISIIFVFMFAARRGIIFLQKKKIKSL